MKKGYIVLPVVIAMLLIISVCRKCMIIESIDNEFIEEAYCGGLVEIISSDRGLPVFIIGLDSISLGGYGYNLEKHVSIGDSVCKHYGTSIVTVHRLKEKDTIKVDILDNSRNNLVP